MSLNLKRPALFIAAIAFIASGCSGSTDSDVDTGSPQSVTVETPATDGSTTDANQDLATEADSVCSPPQDGGELQDQDMSDHQVPWERNGATKVSIYFESGNVTPEYRDYLEAGAAAWNRSPCLDVQIVDECPEGVNCVTVSVTPGDDADGNFDAVEEQNFTVGGHIDLFNEELDKLGEGAKLNVTIHEMGHAVGLRHRQTENVLMNGDTYTDVFDPDETDFYNLRVLYGNQQ